MRIITIGREFGSGGRELGKRLAGLQQMQTNLLVAQKHVIEGIAKTGKDCVIVGRNADVLLGDKKPFCIFVCAVMEEKIRHCMERAALTISVLIQRGGIWKNWHRLWKGLSCVGMGGRYADTAFGSF